MRKVLVRVQVAGWEKSAGSPCVQPSGQWAPVTPETPVFQVTVTWTTFHFRYFSPLVHVVSQLLSGLKCCSIYISDVEEK